MEPINRLLNRRSNPLLHIACVGLAAWLVGSVHAAPSSMLVWDSTTRDVLASGDAQRGAELAAPCASCHGAKGVAPSPNWPSIAGQLAAYTFKQLKDYQGGQRKNAIMQAMAAPLSDQAIADIAAFYAAQPLPAATPNEASNDVPLLATKGDGKRLIPGCNLCHGRNGVGAVVDVPALAGQQTAYFIQTMQAFREGTRGNDIYSRMRLIAEHMTDAEIQQLADYYASLTP